ncbi:hypothetical protein L2E82_10736 [Cichorium intybus]|uniref:Uncharacterized protein n=1 Tax=Cichorium intybus TaxID=13427 RepID=A0ACB9GC21_CICIN|nr:hypothetical protein L2E82_10736 [Cichorium intybus]
MVNRCRFDLYIDVDMGILAVNISQCVLEFQNDRYLYIPSVFKNNLNQIGSLEMRYMGHETEYMIQRT